MTQFKDRPIRSKLTIFIMLSTFIAVAALSTVFVYQRYTTFATQMTNEFTTITKIIADRSNAAILFEDLQGLNETLSSLSLHSDVLIGCTYNSEGTVLAEFKPAPRSPSCPEKPASGILDFEANSFDITEPIIVDDEVAGLIFISASTRKLQLEILTAIYNVIALSSFAILAAFLFAAYIQRFISDPLQQLKDATTEVSLDQNKFPQIPKMNDDEIGELVDAFNQMRDTIAKQNAVILEHANSLERKVEERTKALEIANKELEAFSYSVSHDLKAPLRMIEGFSRALEEDYGDQLDETAQDYLSRVRIGSYKMSQLITNLLQLSRVTRQELNKDEVDLTALCKEAYQDIKDESPDKPSTLVIPDNISATGDRALIQILLDNLISNAWKYSEKQDLIQIEVGTLDDKGNTIYFVKDNGSGFDMKYAERLFKPFSRLHTPDEFEGTGIGLATVARIVERHHGKIWAEAEVDKGCCFFFTLFPNSSNTAEGQVIDQELLLALKKQKS